MATLEELRSELSSLGKGDWAKAQCVMDQIVAITGRKGKMGGQVCPRACKYCHMYGHTREYCPKRDRDSRSEIVKHKRAMERSRERWDPERVREVDRLWAVYYEAKRVDPKAVCSKEYACQKCKGCKRWPEAYRVAESRVDGLALSADSLVYHVVDVAE